ncbi:MAG: hydroxyethylthiazole kinase [Clostridiales bacterium]|nr:hydroxyethylthiazole kinase [Clostridiales bacterium]
MDATLLAALREKRPLIHCISNIVTANDCANLLLAVGASPMMAQAPEEMEEISAAAGAVVLNTGTPSGEKFAACLRAGRAACRAGIPVVLDPVGVGASSWRLEQVQALLKEVQPSIVRVNYGEAAALLRGGQAERGVDSLPPPERDAAAAAGALARTLSAVVLLSGTEDVVTDGRNVITVSGGSSWMRSVTGAGCMLSVLCGGFSAVVATPLEGAVCAARFWKQAAALAERDAAGRGMGSFRVALFDVASRLSCGTEQLND